MSNINIIFFYHIKVRHLPRRESLKLSERDPGRKVRKMPVVRLNSDVNENEMKNNSETVRILLSENKILKVAMPTKLVEWLYYNILN